MAATADSTDVTGAGNVAALAGRLEDHATELNRSFNILLEGLQTSLQEASEACLANVLVYEQAAEANKSSVLAAVDEGQELMKRCMAMAKQLRGTDGLANRVRQLRHAVEALERQVDSWLR